MSEQPLIRSWDEVEAWLLREARGCLHRPSLPASFAIAFHDRRASLVIETPTIRVEDAELITAELCRFLRPLNADQLLVVHPGAYTLDGDRGGEQTLWTLRAMLGVRGDGWRTLHYPLPFDRPDLGTGPVAFDPHDPWSPRIRAVLDDQPPAPTGVAMVLPVDEERFTVALCPDSPLAGWTMLYGFN